MAYMSAMGNCINCNAVFSFNPELVPSVRVNAQRQLDPNGTREPVCNSCVRRANEHRRKNNLPEIPVMPGAYEPQEVA